MKVCIIGAGIAGLATARDLVYRGVDCIVIEKGIVGCGASTRNAGMLHSGARYVLKSEKLAALCYQSNLELRKTADFAIDMKNGMFVCLENDEKDYWEQFASGCRSVGISIKEISRREALQREPNLSPNVSKAFVTPDAVIDPFLLVESHAEELSDMGVKLLEFHQLCGASKTSRGWKLSVEDIHHNQVKTLEVDLVVNAAGPGAFEVAKFFNIDMQLTYLHGTVLVLKQNYVNSLVTRCAPASDGDVITPSKNNCIVAATSNQLDKEENSSVRSEDIASLIDTSCKIIAPINKQAIKHTYAGTRVSLKDTECTKISSKRFDVSRDYTLIDHESKDKVNNFVTVLGGKLIIHRYVSELVGDLVSKKLNLSTICRTKGFPLKKPQKPTGRSFSDLN